MEDASTKAPVTREDRNSENQHAANAEDANVSIHVGIKAHAGMYVCKSRVRTGWGLEGAGGAVSARLAVGVPVCGVVKEQRRAKQAKQRRREPVSRHGREVRRDR